VVSIEKVIEVTRVNGLDREILWGLVRVFVVLAVLTPGVYALTRWYGGRQTKNTSIRLHETFFLGSNRALYVVEWEDTLFFIGVTSQSVNVLGTKEKPHDSTVEGASV